MPKAAGRPGEPGWYRRLSEEIRRRFGERLYKVTIAAGLTCPTRDGRLGTGGCTFCDPFGSGPERDTTLPIEQQIEVRRRGRAGRFIAYLQAYTNTYCSPAELDPILARASSHPDAAAIVVGTRPDCVPDPILDVLQEWSRRKPLWVEYGLQSAHLRTLLAIRRGHTLAEFIDACRRTQARGIEVVAHIILGLPGETNEEMIETARFLSALRVDGVKIHMLHIVRGSQMAADYARGEITLFTRDEYVAAACDVLEHLDARITIHRLTGERAGDSLVAPEWVQGKSDVLRLIEQELIRRESWQGKQARLGL